MRILFVEDEELARVGLIPLLSERGHHVDVAEDADEAVESMRQEQYGLILLDIMIPSGEVVADVPFREAGKELLLRLRAAELGELKTPADVAVVAVTAVTDMDIVLALDSEKCEVEDILAKPIDPEDILDRLADLLRGEHDVHA